MVIMTRLRTRSTQSRQEIFPLVLAFSDLKPLTFFSHKCFFLLLLVSVVGFYQPFEPVQMLRLIVNLFILDIMLHSIPFFARYFHVKTTSKLIAKHFLFHSISLYWKKSHLIMHFRKFYSLFGFFSLILLCFFW